MKCYYAQHRFQFWFKGVAKKDYSTYTWKWTFVATPHMCNNYIQNNNIFFHFSSLQGMQTQPHESITSREVCRP
jgi:hypothetical protein